MTVDWKNIFLSIRSGVTTLLIAITINVVAIMFIPMLMILFFVALMIFTALTPTPSDAEMISLLTERRAAFEALVDKLHESRTTGGIRLGSVDGGMRRAGPWVEEVRTLMRTAGVSDVGYMGSDQPIHIGYSVSGRIGNSLYKDFIYYPSPIRPPPAVTDLHGEDGPDVARAVLCDRNRRADLRHLCRSWPRVNDLDIIARYADGGDWEAERPIDEHWVIRLWHIR